jgi:hypothetical protein
LSNLSVSLQANIMCAADQYSRAIDFYRIAYSINVRALGEVHAWTKTALASLMEAVRYQRSNADGHVVVELEIDASDEVAEGDAGSDGIPEAGSSLAAANEVGGGGLGAGAPEARDKATAAADGQLENGQLDSDGGVDNAGDATHAVVGHGGVGGGDGGWGQGGGLGEEGAQGGAAISVLSGAEIEVLLRECLQHVDIDVGEEHDVMDFDSDDEHVDAAGACQQLALIARQLEVPCRAAAAPASCVRVLVLVRLRVCM